MDSGVKSIVKDYPLLIGPSVYETILSLREYKKKYPNSNVFDIFSNEFSDNELIKLRDEAYKKKNIKDEIFRTEYSAGDLNFNQIKNNNSSKVKCSSLSSSSSALTFHFPNSFDCRCSNPTGGVYILTATNVNFHIPFFFQLSNFFSLLVI